MAITSFFKRNWIHFLAIGIFFVVVFSYFNLQLDGYGLKQHDVEQFIGSAHETTDFREHNNGEEPQWTNSMFGGMPTTQISLIYDGNVFSKITTWFLTTFPSPMGIVLLYLVCFYAMLAMLKVDKWVAIFGSLAYGFLSYQIIILQAGHNTKGIAIAFMAPVVGAFIMAFRRNWKLGTALSAVFMAFEMASNHLQITYYLGFLILGLGIVELFRVLKTKQFGNFGKATVGVIAAYGLALAVNYGNIALTSDYAKYSIRGGNEVTISPDGKSTSAISTAGLDRDYVTQYSYGIDESFTLVSPYVKGGGTMSLSDSPFAEKIENNTDVAPDQLEGVMRNNAYWGDQPIVSGPVYLGVILVFLALLGMIYIKDPMKWALLAVAVLTLMLSWGKNYMGLTNFFLDNIPGYNKFRAVTIILVIVELCIPLIAILFLDKLIKERESIAANMKPFYIASASFVGVLLIVMAAGIDKSYLSASESDPNMISRQREQIMQQIAAMDPQTAQQNGIDKNNPAQIQQIVDGEVSRMENEFGALKTVRKGIFKSSMTRSILFTLLAFGCLMLLLKSKLNPLISIIGLGIIMFLDTVTVTRNYLNNKEEGSGYKYWSTQLESKYPMSAAVGDNQILEFESASNSRVKQAVDAGRSEGKAKAYELDAVGGEADRIIEAYAFAALNRATNYRVFDYSGGFNSARASFFHKSIGGYHGAKLRSFQNLADFHIMKSNNKVLNMLNVKYLLQQTNDGNLSAIPDTNALGNGWLVKRVQSVATANDEVLALGTRFDMKNSGSGKLIVNGKVVNEMNVFGSEKLQYILAGSRDTLDVPLSNGVPEGVEVIFVQDRNGKTNLIMKQGFDMDTTKSFTALASFKVTDEFKPLEEAIVRTDQTSKLKKRTFNGEGKVTLTKYAPNQLNYVVEASDDALAVFSEIYYPEGWKATIDGKPADILRVNYVLRGLEVGKGKHNVEFKFELPRFKKLNSVGLYASLGIFFFLLFTVFVDLKKQLKGKTNESAV